MERERELWDWKNGVLPLERLQRDERELRDVCKKLKVITIPLLTDSCLLK